MPTCSFTARWIDSVTVPAKGQVDYFDEKTTGLGLRVSGAGRKSWFVMYRAMLGDYDLIHWELIHSWDWLMPERKPKSFYMMRQKVMTLLHINKSTVMHRHLVT